MDNPLHLPISLILFSMFSMVPPSGSTIYFVFFRLGLSYVQCIKTIAQAEEPQSVFIYEAQLEETEKELKPQQGFNYGLYCPALWLGSYSGLNLDFLALPESGAVVLLSNCSSTTPTGKKKTNKKNTVSTVFYASH